MQLIIASHIPESPLEIEIWPWEPWIARGSPAVVLQAHLLRLVRFDRCCLWFNVETLELARHARRSVTNMYN